MAKETTTTKKETTKAKAGSSLKADVFAEGGNKAGSVDLSPSVFGASWNEALVHQVITSMQSNERTPVAHSRMRGEVSGGGKKPWRQKGTGRARHGSIRSPLWRGGGVTHGPRNDRDFSRKINRKVMSRALAAVLSKKFVDGEVVFVDGLEPRQAKTSWARRVLAALSKAADLPYLGKPRKNDVLVVVPTRTDDLARSFANIAGVTVEEVRSLNPLLVSRYRYVLIVDPKASDEVLRNRLENAKVAPAA